MFDTLSGESQRRGIQNGSIIGVEAGRVYKDEDVNNTKITIKRRGDDKNKWILELSSCCHTIPTSRISVKCPDTRYVKNIYAGLHYDKRNQFRMFGNVQVKNLLKEFTECKKVEWIGRQIRIVPVS